MKFYLLSLLALAAISAVCANDTAGTVASEKQFYHFKFSDVGNKVDIKVNLSAAGFVDVTDGHCAGDQFEVFVDGKSQGKTSTPIPSDNCKTSSNDPDHCVSDYRWSSGRYFVDAGAHTITISPVSAPYSGGGAYIRATSGICQGAPSAPLDKFALVVDSTVSFDQHVKKCAQYGLDAAQITSANLALASLMVSNCQASMGKSSPDPVYVRSWNNGVLAGASMALYTTTRGGSVNVADGHRYALCQKKAVSEEVTFGGYQQVAKSSDSSLFLVGPAMPHSSAASACAYFNGAVPFDPSTGDEAAASTFLRAQGGADTDVWGCGSGNDVQVGASATSKPFYEASSAKVVLCVANQSSAKLRRSADDL